NALLASDSLIIPMQMEVLTLRGVTQLLATIDELKRVFEKNLEIRGILPVRFDPRRKLSEEIYRHLSSIPDISIFRSVIRENVRIAEAPSFASSVIAYAPDSNGAEDYLALAEEVVRNKKLKTKN